MYAPAAESRPRPWWCGAKRINGKTQSKYIPAQGAAKRPLPAFICGCFLYKNTYFYRDFSHFSAMFWHVLQNYRRNLVLYAVDFFTLFLYNINILFMQF